MNNYINLLIVLLICFSNITFGEDINSAFTKQYVVKAKLNKINGYRLSFEFTNLSDSSIEFDNGFLSRDHINLFVLKDKLLSEPLEEVFSFDRYIDKIWIKPQEKFIFDIDLNYNFPTFSEDLIKSNILIFWHIKLEPLSKEHEMFRFGGYLVVDQETEKSKQVK